MATPKKDPKDLLPVGRKSLYREKRFENYVEQNIQTIFNCLASPNLYKSHSRQEPISVFRESFGKSRKYSRGVLDLLVTAKDGVPYIIEIKSTDNVYDITHGLTQLLMYRDYYRSLTSLDPKLILLSEKPDDIVMRIIKSYSLPVTFAYIKDGIVYVGVGCYER